MTGRPPTTATHPSNATETADTIIMVAMSPGRREKMITARYGMSCFLVLGMLQAGCDKAQTPPAPSKAVEVETPEMKLAALTKRAESGDAEAQCVLGKMYRSGEGMTKNETKAFELFGKAAASGYPEGQELLGWAYLGGVGVQKDVAKGLGWIQQAANQGYAPSEGSLGFIYSSAEYEKKDVVKAAEWDRKAADHGSAQGQFHLGMAYHSGEGVPRNPVKAFEWILKAASQGLGIAQSYVAVAYLEGDGVAPDRVLAYAWINIRGVSGGFENPRDSIAKELSATDLAEAERISSNWKKGEILVRESDKNTDKGGPPEARSTGTAFLISSSGHAITNHHVIDDCKEVHAAGRDGTVKVLTSDPANDIALLQLAGTFKDTAILSSEPTKLRQGDEIVVYGYPLHALLSSDGNFTPGVVSALTGLKNNTNEIQITAAIQPGSSGSPVMNKKGEVVGVVSSKLSDKAMVKRTGQVGQNVNFAVNGQTPRSFLDAHKVSYGTGGFFSREKSTADLAEDARKWVFLVECWK